MLDPAPVPVRTVTRSTNYRWTFQFSERVSVPFGPQSFLAVDFAITLRFEVAKASPLRGSGQARAPVATQASLSTALLIAQRYHRIHTRRAPRRDVRRPSPPLPAVRPSPRSSHRVGRGGVIEQIGDQPRRGKRTPPDPPPRRPPRATVTRATPGQSTSSRVRLPGPCECRFRSCAATPRSSSHRTDPIEANSRASRPKKVVNCVSQTLLLQRVVHLRIHRGHRRSPAGSARLRPAPA